MKKVNRIFLTAIFITLLLCGNLLPQDNSYVKDNYKKSEFRIPMRDGVKLFVSVYSPKNDSVKYPILLWRTPYSCNPYGADKYRRLPKELAEEGFIFVYEDVRGKFMSEGEYVNMRPYIPGKTGKQIDESSDAYDTIDWLVNNIPNNNGKVGMFGISYPGFYAAMGAIDAHPALAAVSPQAPIADWFIDDDMHHHGAFSLLMSFDFFSVFGQPHDSLTTSWPKRFEFETKEAYQFFLELGSLKNVNEKYFHHKIPFWDEMSSHPDYDKFWKIRNTLPHFRNIKPAVLTVGGWYDSEDLYGALHTYASIEDKNPDAVNMIVMGPWAHGGWARTSGASLGDIEFGSETGKTFRENIQLPFFKYFLKNEGETHLPEAKMFNTGINEWRSFDEWPPEGKEKKLFIGKNHELGFDEPVSTSAELYDEFISDPKNPVPYTSVKKNALGFYPKSYMTEDQRFVSDRKDVLVYSTKPLEENITVAGGIDADLFVSTTGTDADWVVKVIDVFPDGGNADEKMNGYQMLVRGDIMRGKYRNNYSEPEQFCSGEPTEVEFPLQDILHTFKKGHKIMIQIQSSWFPFFDMNPQIVTDIYNAKEIDFQKATHKVYFSKEYPSSIKVNILE
ncbi:MAG: CocE/NonD family hydrolase [Chlorobi bacterium]|nr:CocE/NonD family hydrolase [Chlorobiota bacterium]